MQGDIDEKKIVTGWRISMLANERWVRNVRSDQAEEIVLLCLTVGGNVFLNRKKRTRNVYRRATWYLVAIRLAFSMEITHNFLLVWKTVQRHSFIRYVYNGLKNAFDFRRQTFRNWYSLMVNNRHFHWIVDLFFGIACRHLMNYENYRFWKNKV